MIDNSIIFGMENSISYPIKTVSDLTGLSIHVIRAWEKRYNAVVPTRTDTNRRLYCKKEVEKLKLLAEMSSNGHSISSIANLSLDNLIELKGENLSSVNEEDKTQLESSEEEIINRCINCIKKFDNSGLENILWEALISYSQPNFLKKIIIPLVNSIGFFWETGELRIVHEHIASLSIRKILTHLIDTNTVQESAPKILVVIPKGQHHEIGALIASVIASSDGWKVLYMGPDLPAEEVAAVSQKIKPKIVALSIVYPSDNHLLVSELTILNKLISKDVSIIAGGTNLEVFKNTLKDTNIEVVKDLDDFREKLLLHKT